ncbi:hypothetical protein C7I85_06565 [Mesorhizobium soli]|uniref:Tlde1 domain-containing protein n=2 Tax=Pseudaminobacter soli (ex Li et al. 2025) TaxID=1295366 RepID=A0A2P7SIR1_9HYPH|nr:hypothetical protein C7I85_06565 [Mesorhizobium soli]
MTLWSVTGMVAVGSSSVALGSSPFLPKPQFYSAKSMQARLSDDQAKIGKAPRLPAAAARAYVAAKLASAETDSALYSDILGTADAGGAGARFDEVVKKAALTPEKLAGLFTSSGSGSSKSHGPVVAKAGAPTKERVASLAAAPANQSQHVLAYADPNPGGAAGAALSALLAAPSTEDLASQKQELDMDDAAAGLPGFEDTPSDAPLPQLRPQGDQAPKKAAEAEKPVARQPEEQAAAPKSDDAKKADEADAPKKQQQLAYARPDYPEDRSTGGGIGQRLRNMFGGTTKPGHGVAVYDISAAKVYMPDGSVLEAHSGVGKMADDPRYVNVKMNGPTPPHTYNLKMREARFHGVEAIRMLPADGKNKYGRDGFLTHSYLLRGRQAQSHGCVAFKDYKRFLAAFKQGKVKQIIVVPNGGQETMRLASNGKSA